MFLLLRLENAYILCSAIGRLCFTTHLLLDTTSRSSSKGCVVFLRPSQNSLFFPFRSAREVRACSLHRTSRSYCRRQRH